MDEQELNNTEEKIIVKEESYRDSINKHEEDDGAYAD